MAIFYVLPRAPAQLRSGCSTRFTPPGESGLGAILLLRGGFQSSTMALIHSVRTAADPPHHRYRTGRPRGLYSVSMRSALFVGPRPPTWFSPTRPGQAASVSGPVSTAQGSPPLHYSGRGSANISPASARHQSHCNCDTGPGCAISPSPRARLCSASQDLVAAHLDAGPASVSADRGPGSGPLRAVGSSLQVLGSVGRVLHSDYASAIWRSPASSGRPSLDAGY